MVVNEQDGEEIVASGRAFSLVAKWMGLTAEQALEEAGHENQQEPAARPLFLGLGAQYVPHQAGRHSNAVTASLKRKLDKASQQQADPGSELNASKKVTFGGKGVGRFGLMKSTEVRASQLQESKAVSHSESDEDEEDVKGKGRNKSAKPLFDKKALLDTPPAANSSAKSKKKNKRRSGKKPEG